MSTDNLVRIASAGGSMIIPQGTPTSNLVRIAIAAANSGTTVTIKGANNLLTDDMVRIASAGKRCIIFDFTP